MILFGYSGKGKSTSLIPLAIPGIVKDFPGYRLRIIDADGKFQEVAEQNLKARLDRVRANKLRLTPITKEQYEIAAANIDIESVREKTKMTKQGEVDIVGEPKGWITMATALDRWAKDDDETSILVIDSWTHLCRAPLLGWAMSLQGKQYSQFGSGPHGRDYMVPQTKAKALMLNLADRKSNVIVCAHQSPMDVRLKTGETDDKGQAVEEVVHSEMAMLSVGSAGRVELPSEFNHCLVATSDADGNRKISTQVEDGVTTKTPFFATADKSYSLNDGLAKYFMLGRK